MQTLREEVAALQRQRDELHETTNRYLQRARDAEYALKALFLDYKALADSGDAGNWKLEDTDEGASALTLLQQRGHL